VQVQAVSNWERDTVEVKEQNLRALVDFFDVEPAVLDLEVPRVVDLNVSRPPKWAQTQHEEVVAKLDAIYKRLEKLA
jgi:hypothetical protein